MKSLVDERYLVFHGGSGSSKEEIKTAVDNGVVKMNVDTGIVYILFFVLSFIFHSKP